MHSALALPSDADDVAQARFRLGPPDNEAPSAAGVIGRSEDVAALVVGLSRYTTGLQIELAVRCRIDPDPGDRMHSTVEAGLFAGPVLTHWGGGGGREWSSTLWLTPAPRPEDLVLVIADAAPASTRRVPPWRPKGFELRSRRLRSCGRASLIGRLRPFSHRSSTYRSRAGYFRR